ncbi:MAG TPA: hypothetical protein VFW95_10735 [Candidatus Limnocylindria bacterium]|nr:hypothetical protein [Candidatus Limnocylindria bacterium]
MPFLPVVLLVAFQAVSKAATFVLGWATALYFGQVPGRQGRILSVISLLAAAWIVVLVGFAVPLLVGAGLDAIGLIGRNFDVSPLTAWLLGLAIVATPPMVAATVLWFDFRRDRSVRAWLRLVPVSYPATFMLGLSVLLMVLITPFLLVERWRAKRILLQVPLVMHGGSDDQLVRAVRRALESIDVEGAEIRRASGPKTWPMHTVAFAIQHLIGAVVRGEPMELATDDIEIYAYATNVSILGPEGDVHRVRAAIEREVALTDAFLTWDEDAQQFEAALRDIDRAANGDVDALRRKLDALQVKIDRASLNSEEWNVLYRERLQVEQRATRRKA